MCPGPMKHHQEAHPVTDMQDERASSNRGRGGGAGGGAGLAEFGGLGRGRWVESWLLVAAAIGSPRCSISLHPAPHSPTAPPPVPAAHAPAHLQREGAAGELLGRRLRRLGAQRVSQGRLIHLDGFGGARGLDFWAFGALGLRHWVWATGFGAIWFLPNTGRIWVGRGRGQRRGHGIGTEVGRVSWHGSCSHHSPSQPQHVLVATSATGTTQPCYSRRLRPAAPSRCRAWAS
mgnify:CR=1 FL=1